MNAQQSFTDASSVNKPPLMNTSRCKIIRAHVKRRAQFFFFFHSHQLSLHKQQQCQMAETSYSAGNSSLQNVQRNILCTTVNAGFPWFFPQSIVPHCRHSREYTVVISLSHHLTYTQVQYRCPLWHCHFCVQAHHWCYCTTVLFAF